MNVVKIMPCLDMKDGRVVKGVQFVDLRDAGDPVANAEFYEDEGADELAVLDISATVEGRKTRLDWVEKILGVISIPLTVGGGISSLEDTAQLINLGVSKFAINTAAVNRPDLIREASRRFGRKKVVISIDGIRDEGVTSGFRVVIRGGTAATDRDVVEWANTCESLGAGEILLTSVDRDGTRAGYDLELTRSVADAVTIPIIASGGAGSLEHFYDAVVEGRATTLLAASILHFREISIREVKEYLRGRGIKVEL